MTEQVDAKKPTASGLNKNGLPKGKILTQQEQVEYKASKRKK